MGLSGKLTNLITLEEARTLDAIAKWKSFSLAAKDLRKGHSAVVYSLRSIERKTGLTLFDRTGYRTKLTPTGIRLLHSCRLLLERERELSCLCAELATGWEPEVRIVFEGIVPFSPVTQVLKNFIKHKITTQFHVHAAFLSGVEDIFTQFNADMMISVLHPQKLALQGVQLSPVRAFLVAHKHHPLVASSQTHSLSEMRKHTFITVRGSDSRLNLSTQVLDQDAAIHLNDFHSKKLAIISGMGYGWLPKYLIKSELRSGLLKLVQWEKPSQHDFRPHLYYRSDSSLGRAGRTFVEQLIKLSS